MTTPLILLAVLAAAGGLLNVPEIFAGGSWLSGFLAPVFADAAAISAPPVSIPHSTEWLLMAMTLSVVLGMIFIAYRRYAMRHPELPGDDAVRPFPVRLISNKYYIDELYDMIVVKPVLWLSRFLHDVVELRLIDRVVNGVGNAVVWTGNTVRFIQTGNVGFYMFIMILGIILILFLNILT
jgi:NADH-quinone oxidoreductase subunit L